MLFLGAEQDDVGVGPHFHGVSGRPVEEVAPEPLKERSDVRSRAEGELLAADAAVTRRVAEVGLLPGDGTWNVDPDGDITRGDSHGRSPLPGIVGELVRSGAHPHRGRARSQRGTVFTPPGRGPGPPFR